MHLTDSFIKSDLQYIAFKLMHAFPGNQTHDLGIASIMQHHVWAPLNVAVVWSSLSFDHCQGLMYRVDSNSPFCCAYTESGEPFYLVVTLCPWYLQSLRAVEDTDSLCHHANITFTHTHTHAHSDINVIKKQLISIICVDIITIWPGDITYDFVLFFPPLLGYAYTVRQTAQFHFWSNMIHVSLAKVSYAHHGCIWSKNTVKTLILWILI